MNIFFTILFFVLGAAVGSFISVLIYRTRHYEKGIVKGRSKCPNCNRILEPKDLIPILSYILLRGKCRKCNKKISSTYPIMEILTGAIFAFLYSQNLFVIGGSVHGQITQSTVDYKLLGTFLYQLAIATGLIIIFFYDLLYKEIPDTFSLPLMGIVVIGGLITGTPTIDSMILGAAIGFSFFAAQFFISKGKWIGGGDIRLGTLMGAFLGWKLVLLALFLSYSIGAIVSIPLLALNQVKAKSAIPFGPFLIVGTIIALTYGVEILDWYFEKILITI